MSYSQEQLNKWLLELNEDITAYGDGRLCNKVLGEIVNLYIEYKKLEKKGITTDTFPHKSKAYWKYRKKGKDEFGLDLPPVLPFSSPAQIQIEINARLVDAGLNDEQCKIVYDKIGLSKKRPSQEKIADRARWIKIWSQEFTSDMNLDEENEHWNNLSIAEQLETLGVTPEEYFQDNQ